LLNQTSKMTIKNDWLADVLCAAQRGLAKAFGDSALVPLYHSQ